MDQIFQARSSTNSSTADDSENDEVIDFLNINPINSSITTTAAAATTATTTIHVSDESGQNNNNIPTSATNKLSTIPTTTTIIKLNNTNYNSNNNNNSSNNISTMIPTINVTPHSPASANKYNNLFEDTLNQLHTIRESVVQMRNSNVYMQDGLINAAILSSSLPDLTAAVNASSTNVGCTTKTTTGSSAMKAAASGAAMTAAYLMWSPQQQQYLLNTDRRKSWTAADDLAVGADSTNKSISLSSLDSEEQETIRVTEQRRRNARNSTGGISTHSLNEAELARDFERIATKRSLASEIISRIPLQKSISTSSIVAKEDNSNNSKASGRHLTDSEDENQSLLRAHHNAKVEVYDNVEKRRKRGSLFFRKKKDKAKLKMLNNSAAGGVTTNTSGINATCDVCGATVSSLHNMKDHQLECAKVKKFISGQKMSFSKKSGNDIVVGSDYYDGSITTDHGTYYNDDAPLIRAEFLNDPPIVAQDLGADPLLGIVLEEHDSWSPSVPKELLKTLKEKQIKRQEHIYEFIMTEKHHCQTLLVMQKIFVESLERHFSSLNVHAMFPRLVELTALHTNFLRLLRQKQREQPTVDSIANILLDFFSGDKAQQLRVAYGEFCANHRSALEQFKSCITSRDQRFAEWYKHSLTNPLLKKKGIPECILFVTQRLTKYPLLIEPLLKSARDNAEEAEILQQALNSVKALLVDVDACVAEKELRERQIELVNRIDSKSFAIYKHKPFRKSDVAIESRRRLKFEGLATLLQGRSKMQLVLVVVLTDCLCFFVENSAHNKYTFFTPEHKAGVVPLQKLLIREKAGTGTESRGIYIISSNPEFPEMYELKVQQPKDKNVWIQSIRQAVLECPPTPLGEHALGHNIEEHLTSQQIVCSNEYRREIVEQLRQKDIEQALLLEEKLHLQLNLINKTFIEQQQLQQQLDEPETVAAQLLAAFSNISYKDLVTVDTDTTILWQRVQQMVQEISQLASSVYNATTGVPISRAITSVGDKVVISADTYTSPTLPKRAETFAGFDEKRAKHLVYPSAKVAAMQKLTPRLQELEEKRECVSSGGKCVSSGGIVGATGGTVTTPLKPQQHITLENIPKDHNHVSLQITHNLHTLLCIISQQMTTIHQLQLQLALYRESPRFAYTHNDQLEELRNVQDKFQEEKTAWARQRDQQEQEMEEKRLAQLQLQEQIKNEQEDIKQQREQLYRKMELLSNQGLLISPNTNIASPVLNNNNANAAIHADGNADGNEVDTGSSTPTGAAVGITVDRRKDKWRTASTCSKTPPVNLLSANNAPKLSQQIVKQKIPMKLSSLSSMHHTPSNATIGYYHHHSNQIPSSFSKIDKSASFSANNNAGLTQLFPLKLADKKTTTTTINSNINFSNQPQHSRTGSSPAIIQHPSTSTIGGGGVSGNATGNNSNVARSDSMVHHSGKAAITKTTPTSSKQDSTANGKATIADEEEIYF